MCPVIIMDHFRLVNYFKQIYICILFLFPFETEYPYVCEAGLGLCILLPRHPSAGVTGVGPIVASVWIIFHFSRRASMC